MNEFGIVGMGVMGRSLARNFARHGFSLSLFNRHVPGEEEKVAQRLVESYPELASVGAFENLQLFSDSLARPRRILMMIPAGPAVDALLESLVPMLEPGDVVMDGGNSHFEATNRRSERLEQHGIHFLGIGVSGGEEGALRGPALMPGGSPEGWKLVESTLQKIAAKNDKNEPCCSWMGPAGSGHFIKTIHNGIEYAEMQLLAEVYGLLRYCGQQTPDQIASLFESWTETEVDSYLLQITSRILRKRENDGWLIDYVLDQARNKGTGKWTTQIIADLGVPATMMPAALWARYLSASKPMRVAFDEGTRWEPGNAAINERQLFLGYQLARLINHHQGFEVLRHASQRYQWDLDFNRIARVWTNGCIIRSRLMETLAYDLSLNTPLLLNHRFDEKIHEGELPLGEVVRLAIRNRFPVPCLADAIQYLHGLSLEKGTANIIQAQRDCFGAHTYRRMDDDLIHHTEW